MRVLIVDTALGACTACVVEDGRLLGVRSELMAKGHQERLAGMVRDAVADATKEAGGGFEAIDRIGSDLRRIHFNLGKDRNEQ